MDPARYIVRRANLDDLEGLKILWERAGFQVLDTERHLTEFQLVSSLEGDLMGIVALHLDGRQALLHSEAFTDPAREDEFRPLLWERLQILARNYGVFRMWTLEQAPFWHQVGFVDAEPADLKKLPASFGDPHRHWRTIGMRDENLPQVSIEREFELFTQASRVSTEQMMSQARKLKGFAYGIAAIVFLAAMALALTLFLQSNKNPYRRVPSHYQR